MKYIMPLLLIAVSVYAEDVSPDIFYNIGQVYIVHTDEQDAIDGIEEIDSEKAYPWKLKNKKTKKKIPDPPEIARWDTARPVVEVGGETVWFYADPGTNFTSKVKNFERRTLNPESGNDN